MRIGYIFRNKIHTSFFFAECNIRFFLTDIVGQPSDRLSAQIVTLENINEHKDVAIKEIINHLSVSGLKGMVPHIVKLLQLYLVCPSSTATAEILFS